MKSLQQAEHLERLHGAALGKFIYALYRLDLWEDHLVKVLCARLEQADYHLSDKTAANVLLAVSYFAEPVPGLYRRLVLQLLRTKDLPHQAIYQVKTVEMAIRLGHTAVSFDDLGKLATRWLLAIRKTSTPPEPFPESLFATDVSTVAEGLAWKHEAEVEVGPYMLDFVGLLEDGEDGEHPMWDDRRPSLSLARCCVALEADGPSHFYRPHGQPWHWTSMSKLRHRLLTAARIRVAHVPYYDWMQLSNLSEKEAYLSQLLLKAQRMSFPRQRHAKRKPG